MTQPIIPAASLTDEQRQSIVKLYGDALCLIHTEATSEFAQIIQSQAEGMLIVCDDIFGRDFFETALSPSA